MLPLIRQPRQPRQPGRFRSDTRDCMQQSTLKLWPGRFKDGLSSASHSIQAHVTSVCWHSDASSQAGARQRLVAKMVRFLLSSSCGASRSCICITSTKAREFGLLRGMEDDIAADNRASPEEELTLVDVKVPLIDYDLELLLSTTIDDDTAWDSLVSVAKVQRCLLTIRALASLMQLLLVHVPHAVPHDMLCVAMWRAEDACRRCVLKMRAEDAC